MDIQLHTDKRHPCAPRYCLLGMQVHHAAAADSGHSSAHHETVPESKKTVVCQKGGAGAGTTQLEFSSNKAMT